MAYLRVRIESYNASSTWMIPLQLRCWESVVDSGSDNGHVSQCISLAVSGASNFQGSGNYGRGMSASWCGILKTANVAL